MLVCGNCYVSWQNVFFSCQTFTEVIWVGQLVWQKPRSDHMWFFLLGKLGKESWGSNPSAQISKKAPKLTIGASHGTLSSLWFLTHLRMHKIRHIKAKNQVTNQFKREAKFLLYTSTMGLKPHKKDFYPNSKVDFQT